MNDQQTAARIQAKDLRCRDRQPLQDIVPLATPMVVYIDPTNICNFRCSFCPTGDPELLRKVGRPKALLGEGLFDKIVTDLKAFGEKIRLVSMYKDGEPLLNPQFPDMVRKIRDAGVADRIWTKTNGSRLNPQLNGRLAACGLDLLSISVESTSSEGYRKIAAVDIDYRKFIENIADLHARRGSMKIYIKIADSGLSPQEIEDFHRDFSPFADFIAVEKLMGWSYSELKDFTLGTNPDTYDGLPLIDKESCAYPLYVMAVNSDGSVSLCGNDWAHGTVVGNVKDESLKEIWNGERLFEFRKRMLDGRRCELKACANCYYLKVVPDNIDPHRSLILERLSKARSASIEVLESQSSNNRP